MQRLLIVHHTPSPGMQAMLETVLMGAEEAVRETGIEIDLKPR